MNIETIKDWDSVVWVAPDGTIQFNTISADEVMLLAWTKLLHKSRMGQSAHEMKLKGFTIHKVKLSIIPVT